MNEKPIEIKKQQLINETIIKLRKEMFFLFCWFGKHSVKNPLFK